MSEFITRKQAREIKNDWVAGAALKRAERGIDEFEYPTLLKRRDRLVPGAELRLLHRINASLAPTGYSARIVGVGREDALLSEGILRHAIHTRKRIVVFKCTRTSP